jgi:hypothetical protein
MSYCRWSTDDFQCDLYCFATGSYYQTYVSPTRLVGEVPHLPDFKTTPWPEYQAAFKRQMDFGMSCERAPIGLPHDGETFKDSTLEAFKARLHYLRSVGYRFPDRVFEEIDKDLRERDAGNGDEFD